MSASNYLNPLSWPISVKIVTVILAVSLMPMLLTAYYNTDRSMDTLREHELKALRQNAANIAGRISQLLNDTRRAVAYMAAEPVLLDSISESKSKSGPDVAKRALARLQRLVSVNPDIDFATIMDANGDALVSTDAAVVGRNFKFREYFVQAMAGRQYTTGIIVGAVAGNAGVFISNPITNRDGLVVGIVVVRVTATAIAGIVEDERQSKERVGFVIDGDGVIIYHPDPSLLYRSLAPLPPAKLKRIAEDKRFRRDTIETVNMQELDKAATGVRDPGHLRYMSPMSRKAEVAGFAPMRAHDWTVVVTSLETAFAAPLEQLFEQVLLTVAIIGVIFAVLALLFARSLVRPLNSLVHAAQALSRGDYANAKAVAYSQDEIGKLAGTFNEMSASIAERERERDIFGRMVSPEVRDKLLTGKLALGGEQLRVTALFSDIRGFSTISEKMSPPEVVAFLNDYLTEMTEAVKPWGGYVNNFIGDAIVVVFGAPVTVADIEYKAVMAALDMRKRLAQLNQRRVEMGEIELDNGIGISTGNVVAGQMGSLERCIYTVIGDAVNVAARLEAITKDLKQPILINHATFVGLRKHPEVKTLDLGEHVVKGRSEPVQVHAVVGATAVISSIAQANL